VARQAGGATARPAMEGHGWRIADWPLILVRAGSHGIRNRWSGGDRIIATAVAASTQRTAASGCSWWVAAPRTAASGARGSARTHGPQQRPLAAPRARCQERLVQPVQLQLQQPLGGWPDHAVERISDKGMVIANADASAEATGGGGQGRRDLPDRGRAVADGSGRHGARELRRLQDELARIRGLGERGVDDPAGPGAAGHPLRPRPGRRQRLVVRLRQAVQRPPGTRLHRFRRSRPNSRAGPSWRRGTSSCRGCSTSPSTSCVSVPAVRRSACRSLTAEAGSRLVRSSVACRRRCERRRRSSLAGSGCWC
jgi:hypothetical protein